MDDCGKWYIHEGHFCWKSENKEKFKRFIEKVAGLRAVIKTKKWYKLRSINENNYMHYLFNFIAEETGNSMIDIKGYYKIMYGIKKTSELTTVAMEAFLDKVRIHALAFHGVKCKLPNEYIEDD